MARFDPSKYGHTWESWSALPLPDRRQISMRATRRARSRDPLKKRHDSERTARWKQLNKERIAATKRAWRAKNFASVKDAERAYDKQRWAKVREIRAELGLLRVFDPSKYGFTEREWRAMPVDERRLICRRATERRRSKKMSRPGAGRSLLTRLTQAFPAHLPHEIRDDVVSEIVLAVLEGQITEAEAPRKVKRFITAYNRRFSKYRDISLDAPLPGTEGWRLIDAIDSQMFHF